MDFLDNLDSGSSLFNGGGLVFYGGFLTGFLFVYLYMKSKHLDYGLYFDAVAPSMSIGYAIGRLGCFVSGDGCYGFATDVEIPLLVFNYHGAHPSGVPVSKSCYGIHYGFWLFCIFPILGKISRLPQIQSNLSIPDDSWFRSIDG